MDLVQRQRLAEQIARLQSLPSDYWRAKLAGIQAADDLSALPFTEKSEFRDAYPFGMLAVPLDECIRIHASSGTSGKPTVVAYTADDIEVFAECNARALAMAGATKADIVQVAYGYGLFTGGLGLHYGVEHLGATCVPSSGGNVGMQLQLMTDLATTGLACTPSFAMLLAERAAEADLGRHLNVRFGVCGAEPWSNAFRDKLEAAWTNLTGNTFDACDIYGLSEVMGPGVAMECREGKGALHVFDDHFLPEIVDPETGAPAAPGEPGELVLTTLTKQALPVIRYRTRDVTRFVDEPCPCGRPYRRIGRLEGRTDDMLVIRGVNVFPSAIEAALLDHPALTGAYAIVVDRRATLPQLELHVESDSDISHELSARVEQALRLRVEVVVRRPGELPRTEVGKAKRLFTRTADEDPLPWSPPE